MPKEGEFFINGKLSDNSDAFSSLSTSIHIYSGMGIFETLLFRKGKWVQKNRHELRFDNGLNLLKWNTGNVFRLADLIVCIEKLSDILKPDQSARVRIAFYHPEEQLSNSEFIWTAEITSLIVDPWNHSAHIRLGIMEDTSFSYNQYSGFKHTHRETYDKALAFADQNHFDDVIISGNKGIADSLKSNVFFLKGNEILTPSLKSGCLPGILRGYILDHFPKGNIQLIETEMSPELAMKSEAILLTNSVRGIQIVKEYCGKIMDTAHPSIQILKQIANDALIAE